MDRFNPMNYTHYGQGVTGDLGWGSRKEISKAMKKLKKSDEEIEKSDEEIELFLY